MDNHHCPHPAMRFLLALLVFVVTLLPAQAQLMTSDKMNPMDHGPFASTTITEDPLSPAGIIAYKGIAVKLGSDAVPATVVFDTDLLRVASAWTGGFLHWYKDRTSLEEFPSPVGFNHMRTSQAPGWTPNGRFSDPRRWPYGPLPKNWARYHGLHLQGDDVVFAYAVGQADVLEKQGFIRVEDEPVFTRTFNLSNVSETLSLRVLQAPEGHGVVLGQVAFTDSTGYVKIQAGGVQRMIGFRGMPEGATWRLADHHLVLDLPAEHEHIHFALSIGPVQFGTDAKTLEAFFKKFSGVENLEPFKAPGDGRWEAVQTTAVVGNDEGPFVVDELTLPLDNPWNSYLRLSGVDFLSDGRAVVTSLSGDVWLVDGINQDIDTLTWQRFATGLNQPLGVRVVDDMVYVTGRDQITRFHDYNNDGEADFYENFNNDVMAATNFHAFTMNLETDAEGNFYFAKATPWPPKIEGYGPPQDAEVTPHHGVLFKLSPDGEDLEIVATGLRNPNGLAVGPDGTMAYPDNQGNWVPTSNIIRIEEGGFHGFVPSAHHVDIPDKPIEPIVWLPHMVDNSPGSPVWITSDTWPASLQGQMMITSYGRANLSLLLTEEVDGVMQGGMMNLPLQFNSGTMRARFHEDGHLYVAGLTSWQSAGRDDGSFHRVRYTGEPLYLPVALHVKADGISLEFSDALDADAATNLENYQIEQWNYRWVENYGSPGYSVKNPDQVGADRVEITSVQLSEDGKTVFLSIPEIQPVMSMSIDYALRAEDGTPMKQTIYNTINRVPSR